jgi:hypothetical protein
VTLIVEPRRRIAQDLENEALDLRRTAPEALVEFEHDARRALERHAAGADPAVRLDHAQREIELASGPATCRVDRRGRRRLAGAWFPARRVELVRDRDRLGIDRHRPQADRAGGGKPASGE